MKLESISVFDLQAQTGFSIRRVEVHAGEARDWYQVIDRRDLSIGARPNDRFQGAFNSSGLFGFNYYHYGRYKDLGAYWLSSLTLWNNLHATVGVRFDRIGMVNVVQFRDLVANFRISRPIFQKLTCVLLTT
jgi:hypothetical protein